MQWIKSCGLQWIKSCGMHAPHQQASKQANLLTRLATGVLGYASLGTCVFRLTSLLAAPHSSQLPLVRSYLLVLPLCLIRSSVMPAPLSLTLSRPVVSLSTPCRAHGRAVRPCVRLCAEALAEILSRRELSCEVWLWATGLTLSPRTRESDSNRRTRWTVRGSSRPILGPPRRDSNRRSTDRHNRYHYIRSTRWSAHGLHAEPLR
jgi:hypothetical protein